MHIEYMSLALLVTINCTAFIVMFIDKRRSVNNRGSDRVPEGILFFLATAVGSIGIYLAMITLRHKTRKWYFQIGIPLMILQNVSLVYLLYSHILI
jgi:uncharacterized membrane protein YsdA (DUF1294 family)